MLIISPRTKEQLQRRKNKVR